MRKSGKITAALFAVVLALGFTACSSWMSGDLFNNVEEEVKVATAEKIKVYVRFANATHGETTPKGETTQKVNVPFEVSAIANPAYGFYEWAAFSTSEVRADRNTTNLVFDERYFTSDGYAVKKLEDSVVKFDDPKSPSTKCTILTKRDDVIIVPVSAVRALLYSRNTYPKNEATNVVRNQRVTLAFTKDMDFASFVNCTNSSGEFDKDLNGNNIYLKDDPVSGGKEYFYDWNKDMIQISILDTNGKQIPEADVYNYFELPVPAEGNKRIITIAPKKDPKLPKFAEITITISNEVKDSDGYELTEPINFYYTVGQSEDEGIPVFTEITGGFPREILTASGKIDETKNTWSDFPAYMEGDSVTSNIPKDSTNIADWADDELNKPFAHRIAKSVDLLVVIKDTIDANGTRSPNATDQDIEKFSVSARHLLNADGTPGTGMLYEDTTDRSYNALKYYNGAKNFEEGEVGDLYKDPSDGYAFSYHLPENIPDGLIKLEIYAQDITGNSGVNTPYALYVVKDTHAPDMASQAHKIKSASTNTLNEWFNATTIRQLSFKADAANPFTDTTIVNDVLTPVHQKFMNPGTGASLSWAFGNSENNFSTKQIIDNTGVASYDMSSLIDSITEQGAMTFYSCIYDDIGNTSNVTKIPLNIYYDTVNPESPTVSGPSSGSGIYPLTGVSAGGANTFYTRNTSLQLVLSAVDSGTAAATETSSGVAGFLVPEEAYTEESLKTALTASNGTLPGMQAASEGTKAVTLKAGETANESKQDHFLYTVDYALNASSSYTKITVIQDTTGPGIIVDDGASYTFVSESTPFKAESSFADKAMEKGTTGSVTGVSAGNYYYGLGEENFKFNVQLKNECEGFDSGAYAFEVKDAADRTVETGSYAAGINEIKLPEGNYRIVAVDNLGNSTESDILHVVQDKAKPAVSGLEIHGKIFGTTEYNTVTTNTRNVYLTFTADDTTAKDASNTGIRKLTVKGVSLKESALKVTAGETVLAQGTDYTVTAAETEDEESYIVFKRPRTETAYKIENVMLPAEDGTKTVSVLAKDAAGNSTENFCQASIFSDSNPPAISSVCDIALASSIDGTSDNTSATKDSIMKVEIKAHDTTSGILKFYVVDAASNMAAERNDEPAGKSLIESTATVTVNGTSLPATVNGNCITLSTPRISTEDETFVISGVKIPHPETQGKQTVHVVLFDNTGLRNQNSVSDDIIYDTTGPGIIVTDNASKIFATDTTPYRTDDAYSNKEAVVGTTGSVTGISSGTYYYSLSEENFKFKVELKNEYGEADSGAYAFEVKNSSDVTSASGTFAEGVNEIALSEGEYIIHAKDKIGNETVSDVIRVKQDKAKPAVSGLEIHGKMFGTDDYNTVTTNIRKVYLTFTADDTAASDASNTGIRKLIVKGVSLKEADLKVTAGESVLVQGTDYTVSAADTEDEESYIFFVNPRSETSYKLENVVLPATDGTKNVYVKAKDAAGNITENFCEAHIYSDSEAPSVGSVTIVSDDASIDGTEDKTAATKSTRVTVEISAHDTTSGILKFYVVDAVSNMAAGRNDEPAGNSLIESTATVTVNGTSLPATVNGNCIILSTPRISTEDETFVISGVKIPHPETQGKQTVYVVFFDSTGLRNQNSVSDDIIYDTTGPSIVVTDGASSTYNGTALKKYRSNDTANDVTAVTGGNGNVTGIVTGSYFYSVAEGSVAENAGFKFKVELEDQNVTNNTVNAEGTASGAYRFYIGDASGNIPDGAAAYESGADIYLTEGTYTLVAKDKLGNTTTSTTITVVQDANLPSVSELSIHGKIQGDVESETATKESSVYVTFKAADSETGLLKLTVSGNADFTAAELYEKPTEGSDIKLTVFKTVSDDKASVDFMFASPVTAGKTYVVKGVVLSDSDGTKNVSAKAYDRTENGSPVAANSIYKDTVAPVTSDVEIISTDKDALHENSLTSVTNDEKVTVLFKAYDVTSGIKKITICDANGNSLLTAGEGGSAVTISHNLTKVTFNGTVSASEILLTDAKKHSSASSEDPFIFEVTNVSMPKVDGNFVQGRNYFHVKVYDDVLNVAPEAAEGSIVFDNVPPVPVVNMHAPSHFNPYEAYRGVPGTSPQYFVNNVFWKNTDLYYFELSGNDNNGLSSDAVAGFWQGKYQEGLGTESTASGLQSVSTSSTETSYNFYVYDAIGNKSIPSAETNTIVTVKKDTSAPIVTFDGFYANRTKLIKDSGLSASSDTNSATHYYYTNSDTVDLKFKAHDTGVGISYFDISGTIYASFKNGSFAETDNNAKIAEFLSKSTELQVWIDGVQYFRGGYNRSTGEYSDGPDGYGDKAYWDGKTQKWYKDSAKTQETQNVYFNCYKDMEEGQDVGTRGFRDFGLYNSIPASSTDSVFEVRNIDLSCLEQSYMQLNITVYDHMNNSTGITYKKLIYDANKPEVIKTSFVSSGDVNFTSSDVLTTHDLVVQFKENYSNSYSYSGVKEIELELSSNIPESVVSSLKMDGAESFKVYLAYSAPTSLESTKYEILSSYRKTTSSVDAGTHTAKLRLTLNPTTSSGYYGYSYTSGTISYYLVIRGLTIAGGEVDQLETIKVTLKDRAGNVSDNTGNTNNVVQIGYDKVAPEMYRTEYCDDSGNLVLVDGVPAVSYFKTVLGNPAVLSTHTQSLPYKDGTAKSRKINVFPNPGRDDLNASPDDLTGWYAGDDTELVLRFNKNGSGVQKITLNPAIEYRGMFFNSYTIKVTIDNLDGKGPQHLAYGTDYVLEDRYQTFDQFFRTLRFTSSSKCPRGNNAAVYVKGICLDATEMAATGVYGLWCSNAAVTSFAGATTHYDGSEGNEPGWILCAAMDYDTPEFVNQKVTFTDSSVVSKSTYTDGKTIDLTGRVQSKSLGATEKGTYSSGVWAIHLDNAKFVTTGTEKSELSLTVTKTSETYPRETEANEMVISLTSATNVTYTFESGKDFSKRFMPGDSEDSSEIAEFNRNIKAVSEARYSVSDDGHTMYLNMPIDPLQGYEFKISNLQLDPAPMADGAVNITATLYKYSGLSNDSENRIYVRGTDKNSAASGKDYVVYRRKLAAVVDGSSESRNSADFKRNRTNSITLDTKAPVITWYDASNKDSNYYRLAPQDEQGRTVYYAGTSGYSYINFNFQDDSGIKGFAFTDTATAPTRPSDFYIANTQEYDIYYFNGLDESLNVVKYIHVMDYTGHVTSRPVTYLDSEDSVPTTWKVDNTKPSVRTVTRHYYGDTAETRYVLKLDSTNSSAPKLNVYKGVSGTLSGKFTDSYVTFDASTQEYKNTPGNLNDFFVESGSGLYGTCKTGGLNSAAEFKNIYVDGSGNPDFTWKTSDSYFKVMDKVGRGCEKSIGISSYVDSSAPTLGITRITAPDGKSAYRASGLSKVSTSPSVIYLNSKSTDDGVEITFSAADTGENATGVYKVTVGGEGLTSGAEGASAKLEKITSLSTDSTTVTWNLGKGEAKTDGNDNGLLRSITITDWVGNATTYWFKLVSDVTKPVLDVSAPGSLFANHTYSNTAGERYSINIDSNKKIILFSENFSNSNVATQTIALNGKIGLSDAMGVENIDCWYSDSECTVNVTEVTFKQTRTKSGFSYSYETPEANPSVLYAKDKLGNLLSVNLEAKTADELSSAEEGKIYFCYASADTSASMHIGTNQYLESYNAETGTELEAGTTKIIYTTESSATVKIYPTAYYGMSFAYIDLDTPETSTQCTLKKSGTTRYFEVTIPKGKTYKVKVTSTKVNVSSEYSIQVIQDSTGPSYEGTYYSAHEWTSEEKYYAAAADGAVYINGDGEFTVTLPQSGVSDTGSGVKTGTWFADSTGTTSVTSVTLNSSNTSQTVYMVDNVGNRTEKTFTVTVDSGAPVISNILMQNTDTATDFSAANTYYCTGSSDGTNTSYIYYMKNKTSISFGLPGTGITDAESGFRGWSNSGVTFSEIDSPVVLGTGVTKAYAWDNAGNVTEVSFKGNNCTEADLVLTVTPPENQSGAVYNNSSERKIYITGDTVDVTATGSAPTGAIVTITPDVTPSGSTYKLAASEEGKVYSFNVTDKLGNTLSTPVVYTVFKDLSAPDASSATFTITRVENSDLNSVYFDNETKTFYYKNTGSIKPYFNVTGVTDAGSGAKRIGINIDTAYPGANWVETSDGTSFSDVWVTFASTSETPNVNKMLYAEDNLENKQSIGSGMVIYGKQDNTAPSIKYVGDGTSFYISGNIIYVKGNGIFEGVDLQSGVRSIDTSNEWSMTVTDNVGNQATFQKQTMSGVMSNAIEVTYIPAINLEGAKHPDPDDARPQWCAGYKFSVPDSDFTRINSVIIAGLTDNRFNLFGNKVYAGPSYAKNDSGNELSPSFTVVTDTDDTYRVIIPIDKNVSGTMNIEVWAGYGGNNGSPKAYVIGTPTVNGPYYNASFISRAGTMVTAAGKSIVRGTTDAVRRVFGGTNQEVRRTTRTRRNETAAAPVVTQSVKETSEALVTVTEGVKGDIRRRGTSKNKEIQENLTEILEKSGEILQNGERIPLETYSNKEETEPEEVSASVMFNNIENTSDNVYTEESGNMAKGLLAALVLLGILSGCLLVLHKKKNSKQ